MSMGISIYILHRYNSIMYEILVQSSNSLSKHLPPMPLHKPLPWIIPFDHRQRNLLPGKIPEQLPNNPSPIHRLGHQHPHTLIQPN